MPSFYALKGSCQEILPSSIRKALKEKIRAILLRSFSNILESSGNRSLVVVEEKDPAHRERGRGDRGNGKHCLFLGKSLFQDYIFSGCMENLDPEKNRLQNTKISLPLKTKHDRHA